MAAWAYHNDCLLHNMTDTIRLNTAIQAWRDAANDYARIQLVKQYFLCVEGQTLLLTWVGVCSFLSHLRALALVSCEKRPQNTPRPLLTILGQSAAYTTLLQIECWLHMTRYDVANAVELIQLCIFVSSSRCKFLKVKGRACLFSLLTCLATLLERMWASARSET